MRLEPCEALRKRMPTTDQPQILKRNNADDRDVDTHSVCQEADWHRTQRDKQRSNEPMDVRECIAV